jgi:hypothetical protein
MGFHFTDKYSLLHFATGIIAYYWSISFVLWFIIHLLYEYIENTEQGIKIINKIKIWPGGKDSPDTILNRVGDQFYALLGWLFAYFILNFVKFNKS